MKNASPKHKVAREALSVVKRSIIRLNDAQGKDVQELQRALADMRAILSKSDLPREVKEDAGEVLDAAFNLALDLALRSAFEAKEIFTRLAKAAPRVFAICVELVACVALLRSPFPYFACVPLVLFADALGFKRPLKACASVLKAFKKAR